MSDWSLPIAAIVQPAVTEETDIHGTDQEALPRIIGVGLLEGSSGAYAVYLNFKPTDDQLRSLEEHLRSWHP